MFSENLERVIERALEKARISKHQLVTVEILLWALLNDSTVKRDLDLIGVNIGRLQGRLLRFTNSHMKGLCLEDNAEPYPTIGFQRVLQGAIIKVQSCGKYQVDCLDMLLAIFSENEVDSQAVYFMALENLTQDKVANLIYKQDDGSNRQSETFFSEVDLSNLNITDDGMIFQAGIQSSESPHDSDGSSEKQLDSAAQLLSKYAVNINERVQLGLIDEVIGRDIELERMIQILIRRRKHNPLLVGEAGVGKTAIAHGVAIMLENNKVPDQLKGSTIWSLDMGMMLAGTKYRGDFEKRLKDILAEIKKHPNNILFIDEIHTIIGTGAATGGTLDAANLLKPALGSGEVRVIGATTYDEYRTVFDKDTALSRRFQKIEVEETNAEVTTGILTRLLPKYCEHHKVEYAPEAVAKAVEMANKYLISRFNPDKSIDIIDEAGSLCSSAPGGKANKIVTEQHIEELVAKMARIPSDKARKSETDTLKHLEKDLKKSVYGQDNAVTKVCAAVRMSRSGLGNDEHPICSYLLAGPTGVGKTELAKQLAGTLGIKLLRFDMSEYMEQHAVSRLIGSPPGYVGYEQGGLLTESVIKHPHAVVLLDEIEKAHPDIFNVLLQVMDNGMLTDNNGRVANFRNVILLMTSNAGAYMLNKRNAGFTKDEQRSFDVSAEIEKIFTPEFRNRLDGVLLFNPLDRKVVHKVVDKFIADLNHKLDKRGVTVSISAKVRDWLAENGYDIGMGARPMARLIDKSIKQSLADKILFGALSEGGKAKVVLDSKKGLDVQVS